MKSYGVAALAACLILGLGLAETARCQSRHFQASQRHFEEMATQASSLSAQVDSVAEKNLCNLFTATALAYSIRAHVMAQLTDVADTLRQPEAQALLARKLAESRAFVTRHLELDLKAVEGLAASSGNAKVRKLGLRLVNELRVFENNTTSLAKN